MLPAAPPGASGLASGLVLLALPPTAAASAVLRTLRADGLSAVSVSDAIGVLDAVRAGDVVLVVLDVELPGLDQAAVLPAVQREAPGVCIVAVTPRERQAVTVGALRGDRDDYLIRPFTADELSARVRLRLRATGEQPDTVVRRGELVVDTAYGDVSVDGQAVALSPTEFSLLVALLDEPGRAVPHDRLARRVWADRASANLVQVYISYLRRKIGPERIRTVRGAGYVLES